MIYFDGKQYPTITAIARERDINPQTFFYHYHKQTTLRELDRLVWNGIEYESVYDMAIANGLTYQGMAYRLRRGYTCDEDMAW